MKCDELRAAAERIREEPCWSTANQRMIDTCTLADAFLTYLDPTPITEEILLGMRFVKGGSPNARLIYRGCLTIDNIEKGEASVCDWTERVTLPKRVKTLGQLRLLLLALGMEDKL